MILLETIQINDGNCDADPFIEPLEWNVDIAALGGGTLPAVVSTSRQDPWGTDYGYCAWDAGLNNCGPAPVNRLESNFNIECLISTLRRRWGFCQNVDKQAFGMCG